jgi:branched-chain amino acid transport system ATP-binding protein
MIKLENITAGYGKKKVLNDISFDLGNSRVILLAGGNGSGKSTLLKVIYRILQTEGKGKIAFNGEDIMRSHTSDLLQKGLLYIPQKNNVFEDHTVKENLEVAGSGIEKKKLREQIDHVLTTFPVLEKHWKRMSVKLSGGERQLLALAMSVLHDPKMILFDEPFTGLSPANVRLVSENLKTLNEKKGVILLIVEHRVKECLEIADMVIGLKVGKIFLQKEVLAGFNAEELHPVFV